MTDGLVVRDIEVRYGDAVAVRGVDLDIAPGEVVAVIGPSGCGKTTLLRAIAGLEPVHAGTVCWDGDDLATLDVHRRGFGLMFQDHALFPHRDVASNVAFGLEMQRVPAAARTARVDEVLDLVGLRGFGARRIDELSGGEAQRVALARALAPRPRLVMLDEPLGSLDRALRERLAVDIRATVHQLGVAALHVTHDQDEAFTVADRVAVLLDGRLVRCDAPMRLWQDPQHERVARFLGHHDVLDAAAAHALGLRVAPDRGVVLLPRALRVATDDAPAAGTPTRDATVVASRFTSNGAWADVLVDGIATPLRVHVVHGDPAAGVLAAASPGATVALVVDASRTAPVTLDR